MARGEQELFNVTEVENKIQEMKSILDDFTKTVKEVNEIVECSFQRGEASAVNGTLGVKLKEIWDDNKSDVDEFSANFEQWIAVVTQIEAVNSKTIEEVLNIYRSTPGSNSSSLLNDNTLLSDKLASSSLRTWSSYEEAAKAGFSNIRTRNEFVRGGEDKDKYKTYDNYLKAMYDKYNT
ncbi:MAG TPA: hypothetical protein DCE23_00105 [Firmicutes bacterium]|nr:hypothetical protein [Bacillota bacterium]